MERKTDERFIDDYQKFPDLRLCKLGNEGFSGSIYGRGSYIYGFLYENFFNRQKRVNAGNYSDFESLLEFLERKIRTEYLELTEVQKLIFGQKELGNRELLETIPRNEDDEYDDFLEPPDRIEYFDAQNTAVAEIIFCYWMGGLTPCADNYTFSFRCQEELLEPFMNRLLERYGIGAIHEILVHERIPKKCGIFGKIWEFLIQF